MPFMAIVDQLDLFFGLLLYNISIQQQVFQLFITESRKRAVRRGEKVMLTNATSQNNFHQLFNFHAMYICTYEYMKSKIIVYTYIFLKNTVLPLILPFSHTERPLCFFLYIVRNILRNEFKICKDIHFCEQKFKIKLVQSTIHFVLKTSVILLYCSFFMTYSYMKM